MKVVKIIGGSFIALIVVLAIVVFIGLRNLDSLVEMTIESVGSNVTKTAVTVARVNLDVTEGYGEVEGILIKNPAGYSTENAIELSTMILQIETASLTGPVIVIRDLSIDGAKLIADHKGLADVNLQQLYENITADGESAKEPMPTGARPDLRFMLEKVSFTNISLDLVSAEFGERALSMSDIHLSNLGSKQTGLTAEELTNALLAPVVDAARKKVNSEIKDKAKDKLKEELQENLSEEDKQKIDDIRSWLDK